MKVLELLRQPSVQSALDVQHTSRKHTALHAAVVYGSNEIVSILVTAGASPQLLCADGHGPVMHSSYIHYMPSILGRLLAGGADVDFPNANGKQTSIMKASARGLVPAMDRLIAAGSNVNLADVNGMTALHYACHEGSELAVIRLLAAAIQTDVQYSSAFCQQARQRGVGTSAAGGRGRRSFA